jgi:hypothetical protein
VQRFRVLATRRSTGPILSRDGLAEFVVRRKGWPASEPATSPRLCGERAGRPQGSRRRWPRLKKSVADAAAISAPVRTAEEQRQEQRGSEPCVDAHHVLPFWRNEVIGSPGPPPHRQADPFPRSGGIPTRRARQTETAAIARHGSLSRVRRLDSAQDGRLGASRLRRIEPLTPVG